MVLSKTNSTVNVVIVWISIDFNPQALTSIAITYKTYVIVNHNIIVTITETIVYIQR